MSTRFKFRAWHIAHEKMLECRDQGYQGEVFKWLAEGQPIVIEQFTGFLDRDGNEIYEGDVMTHPDFVAGAKLVVEFGDGIFRLSGWDCLRTKFAKGLVIGSVHDHGMFP